MKSVLKRSGVLLAGGALMSAGLVAVAPSPTQAVTPPIEEATISAAVTASGGFGCTETDSEEPDEEIMPDDGNGTISVEGSLEGTGPGGTMNYAATGTVTNVVTSGVGDIFESMTTTLDATLSTSGDADCDGDIEVDGTAQVFLELPRPGTVRVDVDGAVPGGGVVVALARFSSSDYDFETIEDITVVSDGSNLALFRAQGMKRLEAGHYALIVQAVAIAQQNTESPGARPESFSASQSATISYAPDGVATGKMKGKAKKYVALPELIDCDANSAVAEFKSKKKKVKKLRKKTKKVIVKAGKKTVKKFKSKKIKPGKKFKIKKLTTPERTGSLEIIFKLKNGKKIKGNRSYNPCA